MRLHRSLGSHPAQDFFRISEEGEDGCGRSRDLDLTPDHQRFSHRKPPSARAMFHLGRVLETGEAPSIPANLSSHTRNPPPATLRPVTCILRSPMISGMRLPSALAWLVDVAAAMPGADRFLAALGAQLIADGLPLAGGALTMAAPHPIIARRAWLWRAETGAVIEALGFGSLVPTGPEDRNVGHDWLAGLAAGVEEHVVGPAADGSTPDGRASDSPVLGWAVLQPLTEPQSALLHQAARFAAAPLA